MVVSRILSSLDYDVIRRNPKILLVVILLRFTAIYQKTVIGIITAPVSITFY